MQTDTIVIRSRFPKYGKFKWDWNVWIHDGEEPYVDHVAARSGTCWTRRGAERKCRRVVRGLSKDAIAYGR